MQFDSLAKPSLTGAMVSRLARHPCAGLSEIISTAELIGEGKPGYPMDTQVPEGAKEVQVTAKPRRTYTVEFKREILKEFDACATLGASPSGPISSPCMPTAARR